MTQDLADPRKPQLFKKGQSGNPRGRPKGAKNKNAIMREKLVDALETNAIDVVNAIVKAAIRGDMTAAKIIMDRLVPVQKAVNDVGEGLRRPTVNIIVGPTNGSPQIARQPIDVEVIETTTREDNN